MTKPVKAWWFSAKRSLPNGDGRRVRAGRTHVHRGELVLYRSGLHASQQIIDALKYAPGPVLARVECSGEIQHESDKLVCRRRTYLAVIDATQLLRRFARLCALDVVDQWKVPDIVLRYLRTGNESIRAAAGDAADDAAWTASDVRAAFAAMAARAASAAFAAMAAASAAWAASDASDAMAAQNERLHRMAIRLIRKLETGQTTP